MMFKIIALILFLLIQIKTSSQNVIRLLETERGYPLWNQAKNNDGTCTPSYNDKFPNSGNNNCECNNFWAGCASIAMGQIMWRWQWPRNYNWDIMPCELLESTPWYHAEHLQQFIFDCATSANTHYTTCAGSWALAVDIVNALKNNFNYKSATLYKKSEGWTTQGWKNLIKTELKAGRPVILRGGDVISDWGNVHYFIADGYDLNNDNLFHFNFGWGRYYYSMSTNQDALFSLDYININGGNYHKNQMAIVGISPTCKKIPEYVSNYSNSLIDYNTEILANYSIELPASNSTCIIQGSNSVYFTCENYIKLKIGFRAKNGSKFIARIRDVYECDCDTSIIVPLWYNFISPNGDLVNDIYSLNITNANTYVIEVYDRCNNVIYKNAGSVNSNNLTPLWNGYNIIHACDAQLYHASNNWYISTVLVVVNLYNNCGKRIYRSYPLVVVFNPEYVKNLSFETKFNENVTIDTLEFNRIAENIYAKTDIYPNPASDYLILSMNLPENSIYQILNLSNQVLKAEPLCGNKIFIGDLNNGIYILRIITQNNMINFKIVKK